MSRRLPTAFPLLATTEALNDLPMHYCPGCTHGVIHRLVAEAIDTLGIRERLVGVAGHEIGAFDFIPATHGLLALQQVLSGGAGLPSALTPGTSVRPKTDIA